MMNWRIITSLVLAAAGYVLAIWCLYETTALSMTFFFSFGIPCFGIAAILYIIDVLIDLRRHEVL